MALPLGDFNDPLAVQAIEPSITEATPGEVQSANVASTIEALPGVNQLRQQQRYNASGPDTPFAGAVDPRNAGSDVDAMAAERGDAPTRVTIQPEDANAKAKAAGAQGLTFDKPMADTTAQSIIDQHITDQQRADVVARNGNSVLSGSAARFVTSSLISLADPLNLAAMMIPAAPEAFVAEKLMAASSVFERTLIRGAAGAANGAAGMAALEPLNYAMSKSDYDDYTAGDALRNIFMGAALGAGGHMLLGGLFGREHLDPNTSMEATRAAIGQVAEDRPVDVAGIVQSGALNTAADDIERGGVPSETPSDSGAPRPENEPLNGQNGEPFGSIREAEARVQSIQADQVKREALLGDDDKLAAYAAEKGIPTDEMAELLAQNHADNAPDLVALQEYLKSPEAAEAKAAELARAGSISFTDLSPADLRAQADTAAKDMAQRAMNPPTDPVLDRADKLNKAAIEAAPQATGVIDKDLAEATKLTQDLHQQLQAEIASGRIMETQEMRDHMLEADHTENVGKASANYAACLAGRGLV